MQLDLLQSEFIAGFRYQTGILSAAEESTLATWIGQLDLTPFEFHGYRGLRRVASFGYRYDYARGAILETAALPDMLLPLRNRVGTLFGLAPETFVQALVTEYTPGAPIGWHRDKPEFGEIVGVSLLSPAALRFRRRASSGWERRTQKVEPRSAYLLSDEARRGWEHSIAPHRALRHSITFRTLKLL